MNGGATFDQRGSTTARARYPLLSRPLQGGERGWIPLPPTQNDNAATVLVVEDEFIVRFGIASQLRDEGFIVFEAGDADEAIKILEARTDVQLVFTDIDMPGSMDGLKLAAYVRERWPPIKLIVTSGHVSIEQSGLPTGGRFFRKPYEFHHLTTAIVELIAAEVAAHGEKSRSD